MSASGPLPPAPVVAQAPALAEAALGEALEPSISWCLPPDAEAPGLSAALRYAAEDHLDHAFQCVFRLGNERTLLGLLQRLDCAAAWPRLPEAEARYLALLLVRLFCKEPQGGAASEACVWLDGLLRAPGGAALLPGEDMPGFQRALFSLAGVTDDRGHRAASIYYRLFQEQVADVA